MPIIRVLKFTVALFAILTWTGSAAIFASGESGEQQSGTVIGTIFDANTGEPISNATIYIEELEQGAISHEDGGFRFRSIPQGTYRFRVQHLAYQPKSVRVSVQGGDTTRVNVELRTTQFRAREVEVTDEYIRDDLTTQVERVITGRSLRQQLGRTIAETLDDEPGLAQRSMGPAPARPVLRGLGGDRLLILEDGGRTGDLSATSSDHALAIEPMTAEHIELIRGPSALLHGSNTMGGVINVIRGQIPMQGYDHIHSSAAFQGESVNTGLSGGLRAYGPVAGDINFRADASIRNASDVQTPEGRLSNTEITTYNGSLGLSLVQDWGMVGFSGNIMDTKYGVPGGLGIADAHPNGVDIEMFRRYLEGRSRINISDSFIRRIDLGGTYSYYKHVELERPESRPDERIVGSEFGVLTTNLRAHVHHRDWLFFDKGVAGIWAENRDYASGGFSFTPATIEQAAAIFTYQEADFNRLNLQMALRYDYRVVSPETERTSILIGNIRERSFGGFSGSVRGAWSLNNDMKVGATLMRSFRAPGIEELFAEGPHLANFSFEKGNPDLSAESGFGAELFYRIDSNRFDFYVALFRNQMDNYIFPRDTNERATRRDDLNKFVMNEERVLMTGVEMNYRYRLSSSFTQFGSLSYVRGDFVEDGESFPFIATGKNEGNAVPMMPPLTGRAGLEWSSGMLRIGGHTRFAAKQNRTDTFESPTDGYALFDLYAQYHISRGRALHTFTLNLENLADTEYRNHLSRIKEIMPEPGRNVKLLYRVYF